MAGPEEELEEADVPIPYTPASTCIANLTYWPRSQELFMTFTDGRGYKIDGFPAIEFARWTQAPSAGGYFNAFVRGVY